MRALRREEGFLSLGASGRKKRKKNREVPGMMAETLVVYLSTHSAFPCSCCLEKG